MQTQLQLVRILINVVYFVGNCWLTWLFFFGLFRSRAWFFWLLACSSTVSVGFSVVNLLLLFNTGPVVEHLGQVRFTSYYNVYLVIQAVNFAAFNTGLTYLVLRVCRGRRRKRRHDEGE